MRRHPEVGESLALSVRRHELNDFLGVHTVFGRLGGDSLARLVRELVPLAVAAGDRVIAEGDSPAAMYIVRSGRMCARRSEPGGGEASASYIRPGGSFGEVSLLAGTAHAATVEAVSDCTLFELSAATFAALLEGDEQFRRRVQEHAGEQEYRRVARVPLDFAQELLPAAAQAELAGDLPSPAPPGGPSAEEGVEDFVEPDRAGRRGGRGGGGFRISTRWTRWIAARRRWPSSAARSGAR